MFSIKIIIARYVKKQENMNHNRYKKYLIETQKWQNDEISKQELKIAITNIFKILKEKKMNIRSEKIGYISRENGNYRKEPYRNSEIEKYKV